MEKINLVELSIGESVDINGGMNWGAYQADFVQFGIGFFSAVGSAIQSGYDAARPVN